MRYLSLCSGIEAASVAWKPLGWEPAAFAEIDKFPSAVLKHHYPNVSNLGDIRNINGADFADKIDVLVGGTPCQSFSIAGLRKGLEDERGNLALEFVRIADASAPAIIVWENVPGILSDRGNAFGCFLAALAGEDEELLPTGGKWANAGYVLGPKRAVCFRILDAQYFGLAQRRKRVFVIACPRDGADPRKILFEFDGMRRDTPPGRSTQADVAGTLESRSRSGGWSNSVEHAAAGYMQPVELGCADVAGTFTRNAYSGGAGGRPEGAAKNHFVAHALTERMGGGGPDDNKAQGGFYVAAAYGGCNTKGKISVATTLNAHVRIDFDTETFVAHTLRAEGHDASEDGTGRQNLVVTPINTQVGLRHKALGERTGLGIGNTGDPAFTLQGAHSHAVAIIPPLTGKTPYADNIDRENLLIPKTVMSFHGSQDPNISGDITHPCGRNNGLETCVMAFTQNQCGDVLTGNIASAIGTNANATGRNTAKIFGAGVRRLTPTECEFLMGFPRDYTAIPFRGKPAADGPRYKALGNSMAVPVIRWIGERIEKYLFAQQSTCPTWCPCSSANIPIQHGSQQCLDTQKYYREYRQ
jgi:DNA (cytosine-5)-methyltransferase 1